MAKIAQYEASIDEASFDGGRIDIEMNIEPGKLSYEGTVTADTCTRANADTSLTPPANAAAPEQ